MPGAKGVQRYVDLLDFTAGIHSDPFSKSATDTAFDSPTLQTKALALQERGTYGCCAAPDGGLMPLPRPRAYLVDGPDTEFWSAQDNIDTRLPIIAARVVSPIAGTETAQYDIEVLGDDPLLYYRFEDLEGSDVIHDVTHHYYDVLLGLGTPTDLGDTGGFIGGDFGDISTLPGSLNETFDQPDSNTIGPLLDWSHDIEVNCQGKTLDYFGLHGFTIAPIGTPSVAQDKITPTFAAAVDGAMGVQFTLKNMQSQGEDTAVMGAVICAGGSGVNLGSKSIWCYISYKTSINRWHFRVVQDPEGTPNVIIDDTSLTQFQIAQGDRFTFFRKDDDTVFLFHENIDLTNFEGIHQIGTGASTAGDYTGRTHPYLFITLTAAGSSYPGSGLGAYTQGDLLLGDFVMFASDVISPLITTIGWHGDFGELAGAPVFGVIDIGDFTDGFAITSNGHCGNAVTLGLAYLRTAPTPDLYADLFTIESWVTLIAGGNDRAVILFKGMDETFTVPVPLYSIHVQLDVVKATIYNSLGGEWLTASIIPGDISLDVFAEHYYVATWDGTTLRLYIDAVEVDTGVIGDIVGIRRSSDDARLEVFGDTATFDDVAFYNRALSLFRLAVHFYAPCLGGAAFRARICVTYNYFQLDADTGDLLGNMLVRLYNPLAALNTTGRVEMPDDVYDPYTAATDAMSPLDVATTPLRYGYSNFELTRTHPSDPDVLGEPVLAVLAGPAYDDDDAIWSIFVTPDPASTNTDSADEITDGFNAILIAHQGRIVWIGNLGGNVDFGTTALDIFERFSWTPVNDTSVEVNAAVAFVPEAPTGYGAWASMNAAELFLVKRVGGGVVVRDDLNNPTVVRLPGVASTGRFVNVAARTPYGVVYGSERGVWLWSGGDGAALISSQLRGDFLDSARVLPDNYVGIRGQFSYLEPFIYCPNSWVFDVRTESWWRLGSHPDLDALTPQPDAPFPSIYYDIDVDSLVYAFPAYLDSNSDNAATTEGTFCQVYDPSVGASRYQATTQPLDASRDRYVNIREIVVKGSGVGTITVAITDINGIELPASSATFTFTGPERVVQRQTVACTVQDAVVRITADSGDPDSTAPIFHQGHLGLGDQQTVANNPTS